MSPLVASLPVVNRSVAADPPPADPSPVGRRTPSAPAPSPAARRAPRRSPPPARTRAPGHRRVARDRCRAGGGRDDPGGNRADERVQHVPGDLGQPARCGDAVAVQERDELSVDVDQTGVAGGPGAAADRASDQVHPAQSTQRRDRRRVARAVIDDDDPATPLRSASRHRPSSVTRSRTGITTVIGGSVAAVGGAGCTSPASDKVRLSTAAAGVAIGPARRSRQALAPAADSRSTRAGEPPNRVVSSTCLVSGSTSTVKPISANRGGVGSGRHAPDHRRPGRPYRSSRSRPDRPGTRSRPRSPPGPAIVASAVGRRTRRPRQAVEAARSARAGSVSVEPGLTRIGGDTAGTEFDGQGPDQPGDPGLGGAVGGQHRQSRVAAAEATAMNRPARGCGRRSSAGTATRARLSTPPRSMSRTACSCSIGTSHCGTPPAITAAHGDGGVQSHPNAARRRRRHDSARRGRGRRRRTLATRSCPLAR